MDCEKSGFYPNYQVVRCTHSAHSTEISKQIPKDIFVNTPTQAWTRASDLEYILLRANCKKHTTSGNKIYQLRFIKSYTDTSADPSTRDHAIPNLCLVMKLMNQLQLHGHMLLHVVVFVVLVNIYYIYNKLISG